MMWLLDALLVITMLGLAAGALLSRQTSRSVALFIAFGLVVSLAWARLAAPDVALAEAAIGAGLTGALLLSSLAERGEPLAPPAAVTRFSLWMLPSLMVAGLLMGWAFAAALAGRGAQTALHGHIEQHMPDSGVDHPVTAVLLNFRAYDTLLELAVLLTAALAIMALGPARQGHSARSTVLRGLASWLLPALMVTGVYLLWVGAKAPGGAFQAGAVLAAAGILLRLTGVRGAGLPSGRRLNWILAAGVAVFVLAGIAMMGIGRGFLDYSPALAKALIVAIETTAMVSIAAALIVAFLGGRPSAGSDTSLSRSHAP